MTYGKYRAWEILPGALVWTTLLLAIVFSFIAPFWVIVFIIVFDLAWLLRVIYFIIQLLVAWRSYRRCVRTDWGAKLACLPELEHPYHLIFLPTYREELEVVRPTFEHLRDCAYDKKKMIVILGGEEKDSDRFKRISEVMQKEFGETFQKLLATVHPQGLPEEIPGKGSNLNWMAHRAQEMLNAEFPEMHDEDIVASAFDIDTVAHPNYFAHLAFLYRTVADPLHASYQPIALFSNNIWSAPAPVRIAAFGTTFWLFGELARPERLWTFSSHSMPWKMLKDVGFWQKDIVSEDSRIFLQAFLYYHGAYRVEPMFLPVSLDAVTGRSYLQALVALYKQQRRWAWGVEHLPVLVEGFCADPLIPRRKKIKYLFNHMEGMYTWATAPILIFLLGWLPLALTTDSDALIQAAPFTLELLMRLATVGVFASGILSLTLLPRRPKNASPYTWVIMILQWALLPVTFLLFGAFPAIDAQTRLMTGRYLGFNVTKKNRT